MLAFISFWLIHLSDRKVESGERFRNMPVILDSRLCTPPKCLPRPGLEDSQESQTQEGSQRNRSCRHISSHQHQLRFIRGRKGHLKQHQRRLPVTRSLLSILHIPVCYRSCYVEKESCSLWVFENPETSITPQITVCLEDVTFSTALCRSAIVARSYKWFVI